jgi:hypothetical protein
VGVNPSPEGQNRVESSIFDEPAKPEECEKMEVSKAVIESENRLDGSNNSESPKTKETSKRTEPENNDDLRKTPESENK